MWVVVCASLCHVTVAPRGIVIDEGRNAKSTIETVKFCRLGEGEAVGLAEAVARGDTVSVGRRDADGRGDEAGLTLVRTAVTLTNDTTSSACANANNLRAFWPSNALMYILY